jgi:hypothetical protein
MAERQGFEPWEPRGSTVFKTAAFDHSATSPETLYVYVNFILKLFILSCLKRRFLPLFSPQATIYVRFNFKPPDQYFRL